MSTGTISQIITRKLTDVFKPKYLNVINESYMHNVPRGELEFFMLFISLQRHIAVGSTCYIAILSR